MSVIDKIKEIEKKKIHFGINPTGINSAAMQQNIVNGLGLTQVNPNIFGGYSIYENGALSGQINPTIGGAYNIVGEDGSVDSMAMPNIHGGFNITDF